MVLGLWLAILIFFFFLLLLSSFTIRLLWPLEKRGSLAGEREKKQ